MRKHVFAAIILVIFCLSASSAIANSFFPQGSYTITPAPGGGAAYNFNTNTVSFAVQIDGYIPPLGGIAFNSVIFILYDDGTYDSFQQNSIDTVITHNFTTTGLHKVTIWFAKNKGTSPPPAIVIHVNTSGPITAPAAATPGNISMGGTWNPVMGAGHFQFVVVTVKNPTSCVRNVNLEFLFNSAESVFNPGDFSTYNNTTGLGIPGVANASLGIYNRKFSVNNIQIPPNGVKNLFFKVSVLNTTLTAPPFIHFKANITTSSFIGSSSSCKITAESSNELVELTSAYPHDPNAKAVNQTFICANADPFTLEYTITFFNDGNSPAQNINVVDVLDGLQLAPLSVNITNSSYYPITAGLSIANPNEITFHLQGINLPGINQPHSPPYLYSDAQGYFKFTVNTLAGLPPGGHILNAAEIHFDAMPPVATNVATVNIMEGTQNAPCVVRERKESATAPSVNRSIEVAPNPFTETLTIQIPEQTDSEPAVIKVFSLSGNLITTQTMASDDTSITLSTSSWPRGMYIVRYEGAQASGFWKAVKQ